MSEFVEKTGDGESGTLQRIFRVEPFAFEAEINFWSGFKEIVMRVTEGNHHTVHFDVITMHTDDLQTMNRLLDRTRPIALYFGIHKRYKLEFYKRCINLYMSDVNYVGKADLKRLHIPARLVPGFRAVIADALRLMVREDDDDKEEKERVPDEVDTVIASDRDGEL